MKKIILFTILASLNFSCLDSLEVAPRDNPRDPGSSNFMDPIYIIERTSPINLANYAFDLGHKQYFFVFNNKRWIIQSYQYDSETHQTLLDNRIWSSPDSSYWTLETSDAGFSIPTGVILNVARREYCGIVELNGKLFLFISLTGENITKGVNDMQVWTSTDGITWTRESGYPDITADSGFYNIVFIAFSNKIWAFDENNAYSTSDGITWVTDSYITASGIAISWLTSLVVFNNKIWMIHDYSSSNNDKINVYSSSDGLNWKMESTILDISGEASLIAFNNQLIAIITPSDCSENVGAALKTSIDGINWSSGRIFSPERYRCISKGLHNNNFVVFDNEVWFTNNSNGSISSLLFN